MSPVRWVASVSTLWAIRHQVFRAGSLSAFRAFHGGMPVLIGLFIGSRWGLAQLGAFTVASAFLAVVNVIADWGTSRFLPRELTRQGAGVAATLKTTNGIRVILAVAGILAGVLFATLGADRDMLPYILLLSPAVLASILATNAISVRVVEGNLKGVVNAIVMGVAPVCVAALVWRNSGDGALYVVAAYTAGKWLEAAILLRGRRGLLGISFADGRRVFSLLLPFGAGSVIAIVYSRLPVFVAEHWLSRTELGIISASTALQNVLLLFPAALALLTYPRLTEAAMRRDHATFAHAVRRYARVSLCVYVPGMMILWLSIGRVSSALNIPSSATLFVLAYVAEGILAMVSTMAAATCQALSAERSVAFVGAAFLICAIPLQLGAVRSWGMHGILGAVVVSDGLGALALAVVAWRALRDSRAV